MEAVANTPHRVAAAASSQPTLTVLDESGVVKSSELMTPLTGDLYFVDLTLPVGVYTLQVILNSTTHDVQRLDVRARTVDENADFIRRLLSGNKSVVGTTLIIYDEDGVTPLISWDLYNASGAAVAVNPAEARRV